MSFSDNGQSKLYQLLDREGFYAADGDFDDIADYHKEGGAQLARPVEEPPHLSVRQLEVRAAAIEKARDHLDSYNVLSAQQDKILAQKQAAQSLREGVAALLAGAGKAPAGKTPTTGMRNTRRHRSIIR